MRFREVLKLKVGDLIQLKNPMRGSQTGQVLGLSVVDQYHENKFMEIRIGILSLGRYEFVTQWDVARKINPRPA